MGIIIDKKAKFIREQPCVESLTINEKSSNWVNKYEVTIKEEYCKLSERMVYYSKNEVYLKYLETYPKKCCSSNSINDIIDFINEVVPLTQTIELLIETKNEKSFSNAINEDIEQMKKDIKKTEDLNDSISFKIKILNGKIATNDKNIEYISKKIEKYKSLLEGDTNDE